MSLKQKVKTVIKFCMSHADPLMDTDTQRLDKFEPEMKRPIYKKYMKKILMFVTAMILALYIIISNIKYIGTMKS